MQHFQGKHAYCRVMIDNIDAETQKQIYSFLNHPSFKGSKIRIMPDCHAGAGAVIGTTATMTDSVIPNVVGVDIGCGMLSVNLGNISGFSREDLDKHIRKEIPIGFKRHENNDLVVKDLPNELGKQVGDFMWLLLPRNNKMKAKLDFSKPFCHSLGTLGGGNHFVELGRDEEENIWVTIHSGSRSFGLSVALWHQGRAKMYTGKAYHRMEFLTKSTGMDDYLHDMKIAQEYASLNRKIMMHRILSFFPFNYPIEEIESVHNYINFEDNIIRKGAISANKGEKVVIPFNMENGLIIGEGLGNSDWNNSAPHGAGRVGSRRWAKENLDLQEARDSMVEKDIWTSSLCMGTLDEAKGAYKDKNLILDAIRPTVKVLRFVRPIYNLKAGDKRKVLKGVKSIYVPKA